MTLTGFVGRREGAARLGALFFGTGAAVAGLFAQAGAPADGTTGSFAGRAPTGSLLTDTAAGRLYVNTGSRASPAWTLVGSQSA